jgi:NAD(P)-dependent dehydrogenase (short-subunit alcohol dehydrogenase family)
MFEGKRVIVTGGAGALGQGVVRYFVKEGARVAVLDVGDESVTPAEVHIAVDLTNRESCASTVDAVVGVMGGVDVLCNIAGGFLMGDAVHETPDRTWDFLFDLNARSIVNMAAAVVPVMLSSGHGKIINVAALAGREGMAQMGAYTASKAAVLRLTESMGMELREQNINVNCVMPSLVDTERNRSDMPDADFSKWVSPDDIARVIGFLASDDASCIHGAGIPVNGLS